jgi:hypothetical protein
MGTKIEGYRQKSEDTIFCVFQHELKWESQSHLYINSNFSQRNLPNTAHFEIFVTEASKAFQSQ